MGTRRSPVMFESTEPIMWTCSNCREIIEDQFDACWTCGCSREGKLNLDFLREPSFANEYAAVEKIVSKHYQCQKCEYGDARVERISSRGTGFAKLLAKDFIAVSCENCGYTELFNLSVLEDRTDLQNFLRGLFGG